MKTINEIKKEIYNLRTELMKNGIYKPFASWQKSNIFKFFQLESQLQTSQDIYNFIKNRINNEEENNEKGKLAVINELEFILENLNGENKK